MSRVFLVTRTGDGATVGTMFRPALVPTDGKPFACYMHEALFLVVTEFDLGSLGATELTGADIAAAADTFGVSRAALLGGEL